MKNNIVRSICMLCLGILILLVIVAPFITVNTSASFPVGLYSNQFRVPQKGDIVSFCPSDTKVFRDAHTRGYLISGFCKGGYGPLIKKIMAVDGDVVEFTDQGVFVNDVLCAASTPRDTDSQGRVLPRAGGKRRLSGSEVLFLSDNNSWSFDARYFGILDNPVILHPLAPVLTW